MCSGSMAIADAVLLGDEEWWLWGHSFPGPRVAKSPAGHWAVAEDKDGCHPRCQIVTSLTPSIWICHLVTI